MKREKCVIDTLVSNCSDRCPPLHVSNPIVVLLPPFVLYESLFARLYRRHRIDIMFEASLIRKVIPINCSWRIDVYIEVRSTIKAR